MSSNIVAKLASQGKLTDVDSVVAQTLDTFFTKTVNTDPTTTQYDNADRALSSAQSEANIISEVIEFPAESITIPQNEEVLGTGGYCSVLPIKLNTSVLDRGLLKDPKLPTNHKELALKKSIKATMTLAKNAKRRFRLECGIAQHLAKQSSAIHPSYGVVFGRDMNGIIMERADFTLTDLAKGLEEVIKVGSPDVKPVHYWNFWKNIAQQLLSTARAIDVMHKNNMIHCDIKPSNVLLTKNEDGDYIGRLADFGSTQFVSNAKKFENVQTLSTTPWYCAPESISIEPKVVKAFVEAGDTAQDVSTKQDIATFRTLITQYTQDQTSTTSKGDQLLKTLDRNVQRAYISSRSDVWAFGCTILEILNYGLNPIVAHYNGRPTALMNDLLRYKYAILSKHMESSVTATLYTVNQHSVTSDGMLKQLGGFDITVSTNSPKELLELAQKCLIIDPYERYSMSQVIDGLTKLILDWDKLLLAYTSSDGRVRECKVPINTSRAESIGNSQRNVQMGTAYSHNDFVQYILQRQEWEIIYNQNISAPYLAYCEQQQQQPHQQKQQQQQYRPVGDTMNDEQDEAVDVAFSRMQINPPPVTRASIPKNSRLTNETYQRKGKYSGRPVYEGPQGGKYIVDDFGAPKYITASTPSKSSSSATSSSSPKASTDSSGAVNIAVHNHINNLSAAASTSVYPSGGSSSIGNNVSRGSYTSTGTYHSSSGSANGREIFEGSGGGRFYLSDTGEKSYIKNNSSSSSSISPSPLLSVGPSPAPTSSYGSGSSAYTSCGSSSSIGVGSGSSSIGNNVSRGSYTSTGTYHSSSGSANGREIFEGSGGGRFYFRDNGKKGYIPR